MAIPLQLVDVLTRQVIAEELEAIEKAIDANRYAALLRLRELRLAVEFKPMDIDPQ